jgi:hypothetical protein
MELLEATKGTSDQAVIFVRARKGSKKFLE